MVGESQTECFVPIIISVLTRREKHVKSGSDKPPLKDPLLKVSVLSKPPHSNAPPSQLTPAPPHSLHEPSFFYIQNNKWSEPHSLLVIQNPSFASPACKPLLYIFLPVLKNINWFISTCFTVKISKKRDELDSFPHKWVWISFFYQKDFCHQFVIQTHLKLIKMLANCIFTVTVISKLPDLVHRSAEITYHNRTLMKVFNSDSKMVKTIIAMNISEYPIC